MNPDELRSILQEELKEVATREELKELRQEMVTKKDFSGLEKRVATIEETMATKDDLSLLENRVATIEETMTTKADIKEIREEMTTKTHLEALHRKLGFKMWLTEEKFDDKLDEKFREYTHRVTKGLDKVMGELEAIRQEHIAHKGQHDRIEDTQERIKRHTNLPLTD